MGLIKWIKRELDSSNSCKKRQSEPPLPGTDQQPRDESYVKALSKFNEWRRKQQIGGSVRLTRKQSKKLIERRGQSEQFFAKRKPIDNSIVALQPNIQLTPIENGLYEEIPLDITKHNQNDFNTPTRGNLYEKHSTRKILPKTPNDTGKPTNISSTDTKLYENVVFELSDQCDRIPETLDIIKNFLSPPPKFFKENSNPFGDARTPVREDNLQETEESSANNDDWVYDSPRNLDSLATLRANFRQFEVDDDDAGSCSVRKSILSERRLSRNPPYQTVINKHGEEVEYALPLNEKIEEEVEEKPPAQSNSRIIALNNTSGYQQYVEENFEFLNENDRLALSCVSGSFYNSQFQSGRVLVTDLDGTCGTRPADDQQISKEERKVNELEALDVWQQHISNNIETNIVKKTTADMHFGEIIVCNSNEVSEKSPRIKFEAQNGTLSLGTFHCVPVTKFKPKTNIFTESNLHLNYEVFRKIRHPDIALLMGITVDNKCELDALILEPLDYSLHHFIHQEGGCIPLAICLLYTLQITNAVTYLHKHGLIHSNISTHSVFMCNLSKAVKLTSFELTTSTNEDLRNELMEFFENDKYENELATNLSQLPPKIRPYNVEYRKMFSKHNHQAPELLSSRTGFVFPSIQSDVYGICLVLWEMINCSIPFADFDFDEMAKLVYLQNAQLPVLRENRQKSFSKVLKLGLNMLAEKRIADTVKLNEILNEISIETDEKIDTSFEGEKMIANKYPSEAISRRVLYNKGFGPMISERTSTIKKRKHVFKEDRLSARQLFAFTQINKSHDVSSGMLVPSQTSSPNSPQYGFEIGEVSLPETPIARSNKLRKTAWLSNQSISPIVHLEIKSSEDDGGALKQIEIVDKNKYNALKSDDTSSNKLYNVNIRIRPTKTPVPKKQEEQDLSTIEQNSLDQGQKNVSQISDYIKFFNLVSKQNPTPPAKPQSPVENLVNYNTTVHKPTHLAADKMAGSHQKQEPTSSVDQNSINEFFSRSHTTSDFETSLWRREKQRCDQVVTSQRRISVKDAVNKFESFSKSIVSEASSPKPKRKIHSAVTAANCSNEKNVANSNSESSTSDGNSERNISKKNVANSNLESSTSDGNSERNISKMNVVLQQKHDVSKDNEEKAVVPKISKCLANSEEKAKPNNQSPMLTLNFKKLDRRASDIGSYYVRQNPNGKALTARHSIYGTEIFKRLRRPKTTTGNANETDKKTSKTVINTNFFNDNNKDFKIKVGKLTCLNCGHKLFVVDDVVRPSATDDLNETFSELLLTPLKRNFGLQQVSKSTEDFYIDDDFCEDIELCANMELGTQTHLSDFDFDIFSAEIFNASEENPNHIT